MNTSDVPSSTTRVRTVDELDQLPDGKIIIPTGECLWPERCAGRRFQKHSVSIVALDPDPITGKITSAPIAFFKDPLPADVQPDAAPTPGAARTTTTYAARQGGV